MFKPLYNPKIPSFLIIIEASLTIPVETLSTLRLRIVRTKSKGYVKKLATIPEIDPDIRSQPLCLGLFSGSK